MLLPLEVTGAIPAPGSPPKHQLAMTTIFTAGSCASARWFCDPIFRRRLHPSKRHKHPELDFPMCPQERCVP
jgi:hypothetical protein